MNIQDLAEAKAMETSKYFTQAQKELLISSIEEGIRNREFSMVVDQAAKQFVKNAYLRYYKKLLTENSLTGVDIIDRMPDEVKALAKEKPKVEGVFMITINARDGIDPKLFWKRYQEFMARQDYLDLIVASLEQRSEGDQEPYGWHVHILCKSDQYKSRIVDKVYKSFMKFVAGKNYVDVRKSTEDLDVRIEYVKGIKDDKKMGKVEKDKILKMTMGIPMFVEKN